MQQSITIEFIIQMGLVIMGLWAFSKVVGEMIEKVTKRHDREQKWDDYAKNLQEERDKIYTKYDGKLADLERKMEETERDAQKEREIIKKAYNEQLQEIDNKIDYTRVEMDGKTQELKVEVMMLTKSMAAVLDGLIQKDCNGAVTEAKRDLDRFLMSKL